MSLKMFSILYQHMKYLISLKFHFIAKEYHTESKSFSRMIHIFLPTITNEFRSLGYMYMKLCMIPVPGLYSCINNKLPQNLTA